MNTSYKCNYCAKESVCKYCVEHQQACEKLKNAIIGRTTELTIKCKEFMPKEQATIKR